MELRPVWIRTPSPPDRPTWVKSDPADASPVPEWLPAMLVHWRLVDSATHTWTGLVRYAARGLTYEHWVTGTDIRDERPTPEA